MDFYITNQAELCSMPMAFSRQYQYGRFMSAIDDFRKIVDMATNKVGSLNKLATWGAFFISIIIQAISHSYGDMHNFALKLWRNPQKVVAKLWRTTYSVFARRGRRRNKPTGESSQMPEPRSKLPGGMEAQYP